MVGWILKKIFGSKNQRELKRLCADCAPDQRVGRAVQELVRRRVARENRGWKEELAKIPDLEDQWKKLDEILPEAFAVVKNAARRLTERQQSFHRVRSADDLGHGPLRRAT